MRNTRPIGPNQAIHVLSREKQSIALPPLGIEAELLGASTDQTQCVILVDAEFFGYLPYRD